MLNTLEIQSHPVREFLCHVYFDLVASFQWIEWFLHPYHVYEMPDRFGALPCYTRRLYIWKALSLLFLVRYLAKFILKFINYFGDNSKNRNKMSASGKPEIAMTLFTLILRDQKSLDRHRICEESIYITINNIFSWWGASFCISKLIELEIVWTRLRGS